MATELKRSGRAQTGPYRAAAGSWDERPGLRLDSVERIRRAWALLMLGAVVVFLVAVVVGYAVGLALIALGWVR